MKVRYAPRALADLWTISRTLRAESPAGADAVIRNIERAIQVIAQFPGAGRLHRQRGGIRRLGIPRYAYTLFYRVDPDAIIILHVRHDKRKPPRARDLT